MRTIFRTKQNTNFTVLPNSLLRDKRLSFKARGMLAMILSNCDEWEVTKTWLKDQGIEGREAIQSALRELEALGYAVFSQERDQRNAFKPAVWTFYYEPVEESERSCKRAQQSESCGNPAIRQAVAGLSVNGNPATKKDYTVEGTSKEVSGARLPTPLACRREGEDPFNPEPMAEPIPAPVKQVKQPRPRDLILDTLATLDGSLLEEVTEAAWGAARAAKKQIMAVYPQLTPEEINRRAANYRREWPNATIGAMAMAKHWAKFADTFKLPPELAAPKFTPAEAWDHSDDLIGRQMAQQRANR